MANPQALTVEALHLPCDPEMFKFETTSELPILDKILGQPRALRALEMGSEVLGPGFNIFVAGLPDYGRTTLTRDYLERKAAAYPVPDWCYVHNFESSQQPKAIRLPAGKANNLKSDISQLITRCEVEIQQTFRGDTFNNERSQIAKAMQEAQEVEFLQLQEAAKKSNFGIACTSSGFAFIPLVEGQPITQESFEGLSDTEWELPLQTSP